MANTKKRMILVVIGFVLLLAAACWYFYGKKVNISIGEPINVGILHSLTGTMAISEKSVVDATMLAIEEINENGGILGRSIVPIVVDGESDWPTFAKGAERLINDEKVSVVFGCWTSASRKTVKPVFEKYNHLLFYPVQYEGLEQSPNIIYTGAAPNQQIIPAVKWAFDNLGKSFFLVGSDYIFPRTANAIIKDQVAALKGKIVGEEYVKLGSMDFDEVSKKIIKTKPDVILNTINGDSNIAFFDSLHHTAVAIDMKATSDVLPIMSFSIAEDELRAFKAYLNSQKHDDGKHAKEHIEHIWDKHVVGNYASWNYFQSIDTDVNKDFVRRFKNRYGQNRVTDDPMEAAYFGVYLWAKAVEEAGTDDVDKVRKTIGDQSFLAPEGIVYIDPENNHTWKTVRIGKIKKNGQFDIVWSSGKPIKPKPYPSYRSKSEWNKFLLHYYKEWGGDGQVLKNKGVK